MGDVPPDIRFGEPIRWVLAFSRETSLPWLKRLPLTYKHVSAFGYVGGDVGGWMFYDWGADRARISIAIGETAARTLMNEFSKNADLIGIEARQHGRTLRLGGYCVPAIKHLIGLRSRAITPGGLYRDCLAAGAEPIR